MGLFHNEIIAYQISLRNEIELVEKTSKKRDGFHSNQGMQYHPNKYYKLLKLYEITPSMSRKGKCFDNACIEGFFVYFKTEAFHLYPLNT
jgi:putative transposase